MQFRRNVKEEHSSRSIHGNAIQKNTALQGSDPRHAVDMVAALRGRVAELEKLWVVEQHEKSAFSAVSSAVAGLYFSADLPRLFYAIHSALSSLKYSFDSFHVSLIEPDEQPSLTVYHMRVGGSGDEIIAIEEEHHYEYVQAPQFATWRSQQAKVFSYIGEEHPFSIFAAETVSGVRSAIDVPFDLGTLTICSTRSDAFGYPSLKFNLETLGVLANGLSVGLHRLRYIRQIRERDEQLRQAQRVDTIVLLSAGIAHNFNNVLQDIIGNIQLAKLDATADRQLKRLEMAEAAGGRAALLIRRLDLALGSHEPDADQWLNPLEELESVIDLVRSSSDCLITLDVYADGHVPPINMNAAHFQQIVLNVLLNARDAVTDPARGPRDDPHIEVHMSVGRSDLAESKSANFLRINVVDNGIGMDEETRAHIFEPFFTTKPSDRGTGLGLSAVRGIVEDQGGHVLCISELGEGTSFMIYLALEPVKGLNADVPKHIKILVVDDEDVVRESTKNILEHHGYQALSACDGEQAVEIFRTHRPHIVLLDLSMPKMSGGTAYEMMRKIDPNAKILIYTGNEDELNASSFEGDTPILHKPYFDLITKIEQVVGDLGA